MVAGWYRRPRWGHDSRSLRRAACLADTHGDGAVNIIDLLAVLAGWG
jgi:hypothetical protein